MVHSIKITQNLINWLWNNNIYFAPSNGKPHLTPGQTLHFNEDLKIEKYTRIRTGNFLPSMGSFSYTRSPMPPSRTVIGRYCSLAQNIRVFDESHPIHSFTTSTLLYKNRLEFSAINKNGKQFKIIKNIVPKAKKVILQNDIWIGSHVALKPGITLHNGCCVGTGAVVTKDVPPYAVVAGNPAKIVKMRFPEKTIEKLLQTQWWNYCFSEFDGIDGNTEINNFIEIFNDLKNNKIIQPFHPSIYYSSDIIKNNI